MATSPIYPIKEWSTLEQGKRFCLKDDLITVGRWNLVDWLSGKYNFKNNLTKLHEKLLNITETYPNYSAISFEDLKTRIQNAHQRHDTKHCWLYRYLFQSNIDEICHKIDSRLTTLVNQAKVEAIPNEEDYKSKPKKCLNYIDSLQPTDPLRKVEVSKFAETLYRMHLETASKESMTAKLMDFIITACLFRNVVQEVVVDYFKKIQSQAYNFVLFDHLKYWIDLNMDELAGLLKDYFSPELLVKVLEEGKSHYENKLTRSFIQCLLQFKTEKEVTTIFSKLSVSHFDFLFNCLDNSQAAVSGYFMSPAFENRKGMDLIEYVTDSEFPSRLSAFDSMIGHAPLEKVIFMAVEVNSKEFRNHLINVLSKTNEYRAIKAALEACPQDKAKVRILEEAFAAKFEKQNPIASAYEV